MQAVVVSVGVLSAALVATAVGPPLFHEHLLQLGHLEGSAATLHVERAFVDAGARSLGIALIVALAVAIALAWVESRRLNRPLEQLTAAASSLEVGDFSVRVPIGGSSPEFDTVAEAFNLMAGQLSSTEERRRRLLADVAHELRTPLSTLSAQAEALKDGVVSWDSDSQTLLALQITRLRRIAQDLNDVSRAEEGRFAMDIQPMAVADLVEHAVASAAPHFAAKGVSLRHHVNDGRVAVDPQRGDQILSNLLTNALRHTPAGGIVSVNATSSKGAHTISVTDTGDGIAPRHLERVFERFYRADAARTRDDGGSGIGLTLARGLALAQGGTLSASSDGPGLGATFTLVLPALEPQHHPGPPSRDT